MCLRRTIFAIAPLLAIIGTANAQTNFAAELNEARASVMANDFAAASRHVKSAEQAVGDEIRRPTRPHPRTTRDDLPRSFPRCEIGDSACMLSLADHAGELFEAGKVSAALSYVSALNVAVTMEIGAQVRNFAQSDPTSGMATVRAAIVHGDFQIALRYLNAVSLFTLAKIREVRDYRGPHVEDEPMCGFGETPCLLALTDRTSSSVQLQNWFNAFAGIRALEMTLSQEVLHRRPTAAQQLAKVENEAGDSTGPQRFLQLPDLAKAALDAGEIAKASQYAGELLSLAAAHPDWRQGEAIFFGNAVNGQLALNSGNVAAASALLLTAGKTTGSPRLNSFGPGMALAAGLLAKRQADAVLEYLSECRRFWANDRGRLDQWIDDVRKGRTPNFGPNLSY